MWKCQIPRRVSEHLMPFFVLIQNWQEFKDQNKTSDYTLRSTVFNLPTRQTDITYTKSDVKHLSPNTELMFMHPPLFYHILFIVSPIELKPPLRADSSFTDVCSVPPDSMHSSYSTDVS